MEIKLFVLANFDLKIRHNNIMDVFFKLSAFSVRQIKCKLLFQEIVKYSVNFFNLVMTYDCLHFPYIF